MPARKNHGESARLVGRRYAYDRRVLHLKQICFQAEESSEYFENAGFEVGKVLKVPSELIDQGEVFVEYHQFDMWVAQRLQYLFHFTRVSSRVLQDEPGLNMGEEANSSLPRWSGNLEGHGLCGAMFFWLCEAGGASRSKFFRWNLRMVFAGWCNCGRAGVAWHSQVYEDHSSKIIILFHDTNRCAMLQPKAVTRLVNLFLITSLFQKYPAQQLFAQWLLNCLRHCRLTQ